MGIVGWAYARALVGGSRRGEGGAGELLGVEPQRAHQRAVLPHGERPRHRLRREAVAQTGEVPQRFNLIRGRRHCRLPIGIGLQVTPIAGGGGGGGGRGQGSSALASCCSAGFAANGQLSAPLLFRVQSCLLAPMSIHVPSGPSDLHCYQLTVASPTSLLYF